MFLNTVVSFAILEGLIAALSSTIGLLYARLCFWFLGEAHVTRVEMNLAGTCRCRGIPGLAGPTQRIYRQACIFAVDSCNIPQPADRFDIDKAPRNAMEKWSFRRPCFYKPQGVITKGMGLVLCCRVVFQNSGGNELLRLLALRKLCGSQRGRFGDGFLLRQGYAVRCLGGSLYLAAEREGSTSAPRCLMNA